MGFGFGVVFMDACVVVNLRWDGTDLRSHGMGDYTLGWAVCWLWYNVMLKLCRWG